MEPIVRITENWLTRKPYERATMATLFLVSFLLFAGTTYILDSYSLQEVMAATPQKVFQQKQYWRLWTTLFAHGDFGHLFGNALLFFPLAFILTGYFSFWYFPVFAFFMGGITNAIVLQTMPADVALIGVSGVVYWMGAAWLTLFLLIDRRKNLKYRFANALFLAMMIFVPETYKPEVSYLCHLVGFLIGIASGFGYYWFNKSKFDRAEVREIIFDDTYDWDDPQWAPQDSNSQDINLP